MILRVVNMTKYKVRSKGFIRFGAFLVHQCNNEARQKAELLWMVSAERGIDADRIELKREENL